MKSNKGFTLIELLAVIVILAIIALIATPIILNVIDTAKKGSAESSALGYIDGVENQVMVAQVTSDTTDDIAYPKSYTTVASSADKAEGKIFVDVKGTQPDAGSIVNSDEKGLVESACIKVTFGGKTYNVDYDGKKAQVKDACTVTAKTYGA